MGFTRHTRENLTSQVVFTLLIPSLEQAVKNL
jgi:hypothetical protein